MSRGLALLHAIAALLTLALIGPTLGHGVMLYDLGELLFFTESISSEALAGRDYAVNAYGPGRYLLLAGLFGLFGESFTTIWGLFLVLRLAITALAIQIGRRYLDGPWALAPALCLLLFPGPLQKGFYLLGTLLLLWGLLRYLDAPSRSRALGLGLVLAGVAIFRMDLGGFGGLLGTVAVLRARRPADLLRVVSPVVVGLGLAFLLLALSGPGVLQAVVAQLLDDILKNQTISHPTFPTLLDLVRFESLDAWFLWMPLPIYGLLSLRLYRAWRGQLDQQPAPGFNRELLLLGLGLLTCNQVWMKPEFGHLLQAGPMLWLASYLLLHGGWTAWAGRRRRFVLPLLALTLPALLAANTVVTHRGSIYTGAFTIPEERTKVLQTPLGEIRLNPGEHQTLAPLLDRLKALPPGPLWVPTNQPILYTLTERRDVTGHVGLVYYADNPKRQALLIERLEAARPPFAVFVDDSIEGEERRLRNAAPAVRDYLQANYLQHSRFGACGVPGPRGCFVLMERRKPATTD